MVPIFCIIGSEMDKASPVSKPAFRPDALFIFLSSAVSGGILSGQCLFVCCRSVMQDHDREQYVSMLVIRNSFLKDISYAEWLHSGGGAAEDPVRHKYGEQQFLKPAMWQRKHLRRQGHLRKKPRRPA